MKEIKAILQPHVLDRVLAALHALPHFPGVTVSDCQGQGRGRGDGMIMVADLPRVVRIRTRQEQDEAV